jgi:hypothetical protein
VYVRHGLWLIGRAGLTGADLGTRADRRAGQQ